MRVYEDFLPALQGYKFDLVSIDAPLSGDMGDFGRVDTIKLISDGLSKRYVILFDDTGRKPDNASFRVLVDTLMANGFSAQVGCFQGLKLCSAVVSEDLRCLLSNVSRRFDPSDSNWHMDFAGMATERDSLDMMSEVYSRIKKDCKVTAEGLEIVKRDRLLEERTAKLAASQ